MDTVSPFKARHHAARRRADTRCRRLLLWVVASLLLSLLPGLLHAQSYRLDTVTDALRWPWSIARLPGGDFLVTEREGRVVRVTPNGEVTPIEGGPPTLFAGQGGYFDLLLHPDFANRPEIFLSYAEGTPTENYTAVYRARLDGNRLVEGTQIFRINQPRTAPQHYGARMLWMSEDTFLLTSGEGFELREEAQNRQSELGKTLRIDVDGRPRGLLDPDTGAQTPLWTLGHRNPQGLVRIPSGDVFMHEHGPRGGDELNLIEAGENYGWPAVTHGIDYSGAYVSPFKSAPEMVDPEWLWTPSIAPSGMAWYDGPDFPRWRSSLLIGALVDREVRRLQLTGRRVAREEALFSELGERIRDVRVFDDTIYLLTDGERGSLIRVVPNR